MLELSPVSIRHGYVLELSPVSIKHRYCAGLSPVSIRHGSCPGIESCQNEPLFLFWNWFLSALDIDIVLELSPVSIRH